MTSAFRGRGKRDEVEIRRQMYETRREGCEGEVDWLGAGESTGDSYKGVLISALAWPGLHLAPIWEICGEGTLQTK